MCVLSAVHVRHVWDSRPILTQVFPTLDKVIDAFNAGVAWSHGLPPSITLTAQYSTPKTFLAALALENAAAAATAKPASSINAASPTSAGRALRSRRDHPSVNHPNLSAASAAPAGPGFPSRPAWDMLPHGFEVDEFQWWTGFITSRPEFKQKFHAASSAWRSVQQLHTLARDPVRWLAQFSEIETLWAALGLVQVRGGRA